MQRASITALAATALAVGFVLSRDGGLDVVGMGALGGVMMGCVFALMSHTLISTAMRLEAEKALRFVMVGFLIKAAGAILPWGLLTFWAPAGAVADGTAYAIGYIGAILLVLGAGVIDHLRLAAVLSYERANASTGGGLTPPVSTGSSGSLESAS